ncbi:MAG: hypothetical protein MZV64_53065 [Ignavibacteriales bacterium]|nr:hypothetical protein [Ignavibacteriales bacterium]
MFRLKPLLILKTLMMFSPVHLQIIRKSAEGKVDVSAEIQNETDEPANTFNAEKNNKYTIVIANTTPPTIRIDVTD